MLHFACSTDYFPFTRSAKLRAEALTLSLREREVQAPGWCLADGRWANSGTGVIARRRTVLPLPRGEGRGFGPELSRTGEGEPSVAQPMVKSAAGSDV